MFLLEHLQKRKPKSNYRLYAYSRKPWKKIIAERLAQRDELKCMSSYHVGGEPKSPMYLQINHIDENPNNPGIERQLNPYTLDISNLNLFCKNCHQIQAGVILDRMQGVGKESATSKLVGVFVGKGWGRAESRFLANDVARREAVRGGDISAAGRANDLFEPGYISWVEALMRQSVFLGKESPTRERLIGEGAYLANCSVKTTERYLVKMVTPLGGEDDDRPYVEFLDDLKLIRVRPKSRVIEVWKLEA